ncbi:class F sortase [Actinomadura parmotrematis]|uniref:Class F sortase n=1 Tax=Actinomadura parmotrematis TaxID=2864039 RepID=A0ABS7FN81_9ACTN|nr:class F sortase [Actinomadura parmotrematis]MBW8481847.1 class F sortase [Actinomadura parmotrematis]
MIRRALAAALCALLAGGCGARPGPDAAATPTGWRPVPGQVAVPPSAAPAVRHGAPVELAVPSIGVRTRLERLRTDARGILGTPRDPMKAGWYAAGVRPGDQGPAVIAGHVDSRTGPAVFARLRELRPGAAVRVRDAAGAWTAFTVDAVRSAPKAAFPTAEVYGATPDAQLRLITCGGAFDRARGHYVENVIVYATMA